VAVSNTPRSTNLEITEHPEACGPALAQVVQVDGAGDILLGQAWLAAPHRMVTCGHVVDRFVANPQQVAVIFPASGNRYPVRQVRMHPSFVRQPDGLVKFDVAVLEMNLQDPESRVQPLPFSFESALKSNQSLGTIRYPVHLGQLSAALQPLTQEGRYLGLLRKHDNFHMLHDLPLSPGDSGSPLCSGNRVVAIHCGDTASLPGLNLPTTSIRLALWVDALRELGLRETRGYFAAGSPVLAGFLGGAVAFVLALVATSWFLVSPAQQKWDIKQPNVAPLQLTLNEPLHGYKFNDPINFTLLPAGSSYVWLLNVDKDQNVDVLFPPYGLPAHIEKGESRRIDNNVLGLESFNANPIKDQWHIIVISADHPDSSRLADKFITQKDWLESSEARTRLKVKAPQVLERLKSVQREAPEHVIHQLMESPTSK
jgi:hypothetical protein